MTAVLESTAWATVAVGVWLATLSGLTLPEFCFAVGAGILCGVSARAARGALGGSWHVRLRWARWLGPLLASILAESVELLRVAATNPRSGRMVRYELSDEPVPALMAREALGTVAISATPGSVVADCEPEKRRLTVHVLVSAGPAMQEVIRR